MPGITYYPGAAALSGKLVFMLAADAEGRSNQVASAALYELPLPGAVLRQVAVAPGGDLFCSEDGETFCVICWSGNWSSGTATNAYVFSTAPMESRLVNLPAHPSDTLVVGQHVLFQTEEPDDAAGTCFTKLWHYDMAAGQLRQVAFADGSRWQYEAYRNMAVPGEAPGYLYFHYSPAGKRLSDGRDYEPGIYRYALRTGALAWVGANPGLPQATKGAAINGRHVYFEGQGAPLTGFSLVSSPWDETWTQTQDPEGKQKQILHQFSRVAAAGGGYYVLTQISPCGRYALVRLMEPTTRRKGALPGWISTYYLVDVTNGCTSVFLKDRVEKETSGAMSTLHWVRSSP